MVVLWYGLIAAFLSSAVGAVCSWLWYRADGGNEAFYAATSATVFAVLSLVGIIVQYIFAGSANEESETGRPKKNANLLLAWLLRHVPSKDLSRTLPEALRLAKLLGDRDFERWVRCELNGYLNPQMNDTDVVPEYRTVTGRHKDIYGRPLMIDDPDLSFVNEDRLRLGVRELEAHAKKDGMLYIQNTSSNQLIKRHLGVDVVQFEFNRASIYGILDAIRSELLDRLHRIDNQQEAGEASAVSAEERADRYRRRKELYQKVRYRLNREKNNLARLAEDPKSAEGEVYTETTPFELIRDDFQPLTTYEDDAVLAENIIRECENILVLPSGRRSVTALMPLLKELDAKTAQWLNEARVWPA